jgi:hypothetical protein
MLWTEVPGKFLALGLPMLIGVLALAVAMPAQAQRPEGKSTAPEWKPGICERTAEPDPFRGMPAYKKPSLTELHEELRQYPEPHDTYLALIELGNEETVPLLLDRLRLDYGASEPPPLPLNMVRGVICTQAHLIEALSSITNTDQGMYYPRWAAWWEANRNLPRERWVLDGFAAIGLHAVQPVDDRFGLELIELLPGENAQNAYQASNARRLLAGLPQTTRAGWVTRAAASGDRTLRLGALDVLSRIDTTGHEDLIRKLAVDTDLEIRRGALTTFNQRLRVALSTEPTGPAGFCRAELSSERRIRSVTFAGDLLIVAYDDRVTALETRTRRELWTQRAMSGTGEMVLAAGERVILASREGAVLALDLRGRVLWSRKLGEDGDDEIRRLVPRGDDIVVVRERALELLDSRTGETISRDRAVDFIRDADSGRESVYYLDGHGLRPLSGGPGHEVQFPDALGVSVTGKAVCLTAGRFGHSGRLTCLTADTLIEQWSRPIGDVWTGGHGVAPVQDGVRVFAPTDKDLTAFDASSGSLLWTAEGGRESHGTIIPTPYGLLLENSDYHVELRDPQTGEVRRVWPRIHGVWHIAVHERFAAVADMDEILWLVDLSDEGNRR